MLNGWSVSVSNFFFFFFFAVVSHQIYFSFPLINTHKTMAHHFGFVWTWRMWFLNVMLSLPYMKRCFIFPICHQLCQVLLLQNSDLTCRNSVRKCGERFKNRFDWLTSQYNTYIHTCMHDLRAHKIARAIATLVIWLRLFVSIFDSV